MQAAKKNVCCPHLHLEDCMITSLFFEANFDKQTKQASWRQRQSCASRHRQVKLFPAATSKIKTAVATLDTPNKLLKDCQDLHLKYLFICIPRKCNLPATMESLA